jgi:glycosyltransferase involved in cell wall biosynthesis
VTSSTYHGAMSASSSTQDGGRNLELLSVVAPVFNEEALIDEFYGRVCGALDGVRFELVLVDDGSSDGTAELLDGRDWGPRVRVIHHPVNQGKGAAVRTALAEATGEFAAIMDADLEYDPQDLDRLLRPLLAGDTNAVFGVRAFNGYTSHSFVYVLGNRAVTLACNVLFNVYLTDIMTCQKVIRTDVFRGLGLTESGFAIESEITARLIQAGELIYEVPAAYRARGHAAGKKLTTRDGFRVLATLARCRLGARRRRAADAPLPPHRRDP